MELDGDWYERGYLPHQGGAGLVQFVTYRLWDSVPEEAREGIRLQLLGTPANKLEQRLRQRIENLLDSGIGSCVLARPEAARCVVENWMTFAGRRYDLLEWVVMPNHVHVLIRGYSGWPLHKIVQSWKSYTGRQLAEMMWGEVNRSQDENSRQGWRKVWMREFWDRYVRDETHFHRSVEYIRNNPVKAGLVVRPEDWPWSSAGWKDNL